MSTIPNGTPISRAERQAELQTLASKLIEAMRNVQTELLRDFERYQLPMGTRMAELEPDQRNLEASASPWLAQLEQQITENMRLLKLEGRMR